jgi:hypothetical protein
MLGAQRASLDSDELHAGAPLQPILGACRNTALAKQCSGGQKKLVGSGAGRKDAESAAHEREM